MYLRKCTRKKSNKEYIYWELVESYQSERGKRQRVVAYLGNLSKPAREGLKLALEDRCISQDLQLFDEDLTPEYAQIDTKNVRLERSRDFGGVWLALHLMGLLGLPRFFQDAFTSHLRGYWASMAMVHVSCRLCSPSSELQIANSIYKRTALEDLLGLPARVVNDDRLYRSLDKLIVHKQDLEIHLKKRMGELFGIDYDLLLYDVTSTFIEGSGASNEQMKLGYSRDQRPDCKQVCIALIVTKEGMPLGYELFDGNRTDVTTVEEIVGNVEERYGKADRIWVMDRGMMSASNLDFLKKEGRRYILGTSRSMLKKFEQELLKDDWNSIRDGLEVKKCISEDGEETFILCRSRDRQQKEAAIHEKFEKRIENGLAQMVTACQKKKLSRSVLDRRIGALLSKNSRAKRLFQVEVKLRDDGGCDVIWEKVEANRKWSELSEGCYLLRSNIKDWSAEDLWKAYTQLTEAEYAFRIHKTDLQLRPIWHQKKERVQAHIFVCFLAYVLWKTFGQLCKRAGLGDEPRQIFDELAQIKMADVVMKTKSGIEIRRRCIVEPEKHQKVLLDMLQLRLPKQLKLTQK